MKLMTIMFIAALAFVIFSGPLYLVAAPPDNATKVENESESEESAEDFFDPTPDAPSTEQPETGQEEKTSSLQEKADELTHEYRLLVEQNRLKLLAAVCLAGVICLFTILWFISRSDAYTSQDIVTSSGLVLIIMGTIMIILIADTGEALTAPMGIMGAIAGYLFGRMNKP